MPYPTCDHRMPDGALWGSPALRGQKFCYFHKRDYKRRVQMARARRRAENCPMKLPVLAELRDVRTALTQVIDTLAANRIDPKRAGAMLFALQQAAM